MEAVRDMKRGESRAVSNLIDREGSIDKSNSVILDDTRCLRCDYRLRGLTPNAHCPECGLPASVSIGRGQLRLSSPAYVATLHTALVFLWYGSALALGYHLLRLMVGFRNAWILSLAQVPGLIGLWLIATPDPRGLGTATMDSVRKFLKVSVVMSLVDLATLLMPLSLWRRLPLDVWAWLGVVLLALDYAGSVALMVYLTALAGHIPSAKLTRFAKQMAWSIGALAVVSVAAHSIRQASNFGSIFRLQSSHVIEVIAWLSVPVNLGSLLLFRGIGRRVRQQLPLVGGFSGSEPDCL